MVISIMESGPSEPRARRHVRNRSLHGLRGLYWVYPRVLWHMYSIRGFNLFMLVFLLCCWPASASFGTFTFPSTLVVCYFVLCFDFSLVCACRSRWGPCMRHEALSGHTCKPSFLPSFHCPYRACMLNAAFVSGDWLSCALGHTSFALRQAAGRGPW